MHQERCEYEDQAIDLGEGEDGWKVPQILVPGFRLGERTPRSLEWRTRISNYGNDD